MQRSVEREGNGKIAGEMQLAHDAYQHAEAGEQQKMSWVEKSLGFHWAVRDAASDANLTGQNVPPQLPVAHQAEPGIFERCRLIVLKKEVADPGESVALHERDGD